MHSPRPLLQHSQWQLLLPMHTPFLELPLLSLQERCLGGKVKQDGQIESRMGSAST